MGLENIGSFTTPTPVAPGSRGTPNWGATFLPDLFQNERYAAAVREETFNQFAFVRSGLITSNPLLNVSEGGVKATLPHILPVDVFEEVIESNDTWGESGAGYLTPQKVNAGLQQYPIMHRSWMIGTDKLSELGSGLDPLSIAQSYTAANMAKFMTAQILSYMDGLFLPTGALTANISDVSRTGAGTSTAANFLTASAVTRARTKLGERGSRLQFIAMHSDIANYLSDVGMLTFSTDALTAGGNIQWGGGGVGVTNPDVSFFAGCRVIVDDLLAPTIDATNGDKYPIYLYERNAVQLGNQIPLNIDYQYNVPSKQWLYSPDYHNCLAVPGTTYSGPVGSPKNADMADPANWTLVYDQGPKMVPIVKVIANCPYATNP